MHLYIVLMAGLYEDGDFKYFVLFLQTLKSHYCPEVSVLVSNLISSLDKKSEENIGKYLDKDFDDVNYYYMVNLVNIFLFFRRYFQLQRLSCRTM